MPTLAEEVAEVVRPAVQAVADDVRALVARVEVVAMTQAAYDALTSAEQADVSKVYIITP